MPMFEGWCASEVLQSAPRCADYTGALLKCLYTNAHSMRNKQEELEALAWSQNYDIIGISKTWWDESCDWGAMMDSYRVFRRDRQGRQGRGLAPYVREGLDCMALVVGDDTVESLWSSKRGRRLAWLIRDLLLELRKEGKVYGHWKQGQATREDYRDDVCHGREKMCATKAQLEFTLVSTVKDNKKGFLKYLNSKRRIKRLHWAVA
ncbi:hypothetical protein QYF61_019098 [Mycteria americana]|uniref:Mitochondrial fission process protein 1 n=1 Tax=Mycteria americana TaxID=33587 RepID=A0AAN7S8V3_MYCAM|nr:hypothetical protein QYF61_019098 [Mycteria americana]